ncbi:MAG: NAD(P)/FAD-dependent oxidoreductase [Acholeplasmataceae bacterium]
MLDYDVIIVGGGPAGLMAANQFEAHHVNYLLLEKHASVGTKLLLTGGRRCNVTNNQHVDQFIEHLSVKNKRFIYASLMSFGPTDIIDFFKSKGLALRLENQFKYFPETEKSQSVLDALTKDIHPSRILTHHPVKKILKENNQWVLHVNEKKFSAKHVIVAVGSHSFPKTGSTGDGLIFAKDLSISYTPYTPAETHVYAQDVSTRLRDLQGLSLSQIEMSIRGTKKKVVDDVIFTHFGLSGPGIMHLSEDMYAFLQQQKTELEFKLISLDEQTFDMVLHQATKEKTYLLKWLDDYLPKRLSRKILELMDIKNCPTQQLQQKDIIKLKDYLFHFKIPIDRVEDKERAYVNAGGIDLSELNPKTLMVKQLPNLYFIGEVIHIHGPIGGYNITMALSMGHLCAKGIVNDLK